MSVRQKYETRLAGRAVCRQRAGFRTWRFSHVDTCLSTKWVRKQACRNNPERSREPSRRGLISGIWAIAGTGTLFLVDKGFSVLSYSPPSFALARWFFGASAALLILAIIITASQVNAPFAIRAIVAAGVVFASCCLLLVGVIWIAWRESDFRSHQQIPTLSSQPTATQSTTTTASVTAAAAPQPSQPSSFSATTETTERKGERDSAGELLTIPAIEIIKPYRSMTDVDASQRTRRYIGKWITAGGTVTNVSDESDSTTVYAWFVADENNSNNTALFVLRFTDSDQRAAARSLKRNEKFKAVGKITLIESTDIRLESCRLISP